MNYHVVPDAPRCPDCGGPTHAVATPKRVRRGDKHVAFEGIVWSCGRDEADASTEPFRFENTASAAYNDALAAAAWEQVHGETFPDARPPGPNRRHTERVHIRMEPEDISRLDGLAEARGKTRSQVVRALIAEAAPANHSFECVAELRAFAATRKTREAAAPVLANA